MAPYPSFVVLECTNDIPDVAFAALRRFLLECAKNRGSALGVRVAAEFDSSSPNYLGDFGALELAGFDHLYAVARERVQRPSWAAKDSGFNDISHDLAWAVQRNRLVALQCKSIVSVPALQKWLRRPLTPFRLLPAAILAGTFDGDVRAVWMRGIQRPRTTKADTKTASHLG